MTDTAMTTEALKQEERQKRIRANLKARHAAEKRFRAYGLMAIGAALLALSTLFFTIISNGASALLQTEMRLTVHLDTSLDPEGTGDPAILSKGNYYGLIKDSMRAMFPEVSGRRDKKTLYKLVSSGAQYELREFVMENPDLVGQTVEIWVPAADDIDMLMKGYIDRDLPEGDRRVNDKQLAWVDQLLADDALEKKFNTRLFTSGDSREPELAGFAGAAVGSFWTLIVTLLLSFPIGVAAAVYLEEFAPKNKWTDLIEVNINNLAAVPSIVFGLLGLALFLNWFGLPRSAPLVGGMVLTLMTLPTIIIASRASLKSVPPSIREAALGMGASRLQVVGHHVLPLALPGMLTGTIIGMAQALGETAPLLMIGMVAFIADIPGGPTDPSTVMPVQIYLWADSPERAFVERTSAAIMALLAFLIMMNLSAVLLRKRFERRW